MALASIDRQGDTLTVRPSGRLDTARTPLLDRELHPHLDGVRQIVMDFSQVEYITSSCLRLLLWLEQMLEERDGEVQLIHPNQAIMRVIKLAGFDYVVHVIPD